MYSLLALCCLSASVSAAPQEDPLGTASHLLQSAVSDPSPEPEQSEETIGSGLKEVLRVGTDAVVAQLGERNAFNGDPAIRIPLPASLEQVRSELDKVGLGSPLQHLELRINRAAERATPKLRDILFQAIADLALDDVLETYRGPADAATRRFRARMSEQLTVEMRPVVEESLSAVGALRSYKSAMDVYNLLPSVPKVETDLTGHVVEMGMAGIFLYLAREEAAIRGDPLKRSTVLLQDVFRD